MPLVEVLDPMIPATGALMRVIASCRRGGDNGEDDTIGLWLQLGDGPLVYMAVVDSVRFWVPDPDPPSSGAAGGGAQAAGTTAKMTPSAAGGGGYPATRAAGGTSSSSAPPAPPAKAPPAKAPPAKSAGTGPNKLPKLDT